jgi:hypothetical protein
LYEIKKNILERPLVVYMDGEASIIPMNIRDNENAKLLNKQVIHNCCFVVFDLWVHLKINYMILEMIIV